MHAHAAEASLMVAFLDANRVNGVATAEAMDFATFAVEALMNGAKVNWEDRIINSLTNLCAKAIFIELENGIFEDHPLKAEVQVAVSNPLTLNFSESILKLFNDSINSHLVIQNGNTGGSNAQTLRTTITLGNDYLSNATKLSIARTMIHESVHAYINGVFFSYP
ncbi:MAG: hypothetical protein ABF257_05145, partial [Polaribacter sp.]